MAIDKVGSGLPIIPSSDGPNKAKESKRASEKKDKVELSDEAKMLYASEKAKKVGTIRANIKNGFYEAPEVTEKVVEGLLKELKQPQA